MKKAEIRQQIINTYKNKHQKGIIHKNALGEAELNMLDFCIEYFAELSGGEDKKITLRERIIKLIQEGYNIEAIRTYKNEMSCDLREAKYQVGLIRDEIKEDKISDKKKSTNDDIIEYLL